MEVVGLSSLKAGEDQDIFVYSRASSPSSGQAVRTRVRKYTLHFTT